MWGIRALAAAGLWTQVALGADFDWSAIVPSEQLHYHPCYDGYQCARLSVPRDWQDANNTKRVAIAITTLPATVPSDDPSFGGTIIINPGGPGGSGVRAVQSYGRRLQAMTEGKKHYAILGFDPRGIAYTTPRADCFGGSHIFARDSLILESRGIGGLDASDNGLRRILALDQAFGSLCETKDLDDDILAYVSTASVARDIIEITDRTEELRRAERIAPLDTKQHPISAGTEHSHDKPARVLYWGFSYGTILGNTLTSMFPGRMGRVVLDGVDDIYDYYEGKWLNNLLDTEKIVDYFYGTCFDGTENCPLWESGDKSSDDIRSRVDKLISDVDQNPISLVQSDGSSNLRVITGNDIRQVFILPLYAPLPFGFTYLATALAHALKGNYSIIAINLQLPLLQDACSIHNSTEQGLGDAQTSILCGDADYADPDGRYHSGEKQGFPFWKENTEKLKNQSSTMGPFWAGIASTCSGWRVRPKWRYAGPWGTPPADPGLKEGAPAAPVLLTTSRLDPVTPLHVANLMSNDHPGSAVLIHETVGHCAMATGWSECFNEHIRAYFDDGIMPANGTVCDTTCKPFSKDGLCLPPAAVVAAGGDGNFFDFAADRRSRWSFRPLGII
ncbi:hypothetical protein J7T55_013911 [Diaporthe amygdali]|uniref:uncharacterized protein n=1 Tax=Phomopsis amygdali TaxID=1214568 RepID=UPI0022FEC83C|nr:uncharacterized protein J7T55_013911 [Diaporthe amygdali]KAJ0119708.1 hypothetical protein J7T55_013911 [Diaporthe amygdali]